MRRLGSFLKRLFAGKPVVESVCLSMLESNGRTGTTKTKKWYHLKLQFSLFLLSQYISCSPVWQFCTTWTASCKQPVHGTNFQLKSAVVRLFQVECGQRRFTTTRNYRNHEIQYCIAFPGLLSRIVGSQHPASRASLAVEEKRKLCLNEVWGRRSPNFWTKQSSFLFCLVKLVFFRVWASIYI